MTRQDKTRLDKTRQNKTGDKQDKTTSLTSEKSVYIQPIKTVTDVTDVIELRDFKPIDMFLIRHITGKTSVDGAEVGALLNLYLGHLS